MRDSENSSQKWIQVDVGRFIEVHETDGDSHDSGQYELVGKHCRREMAGSERFVCINSGQSISSSIVGTGKRPTCGVILLLANADGMDASILLGGDSC